MNAETKFIKALETAFAEHYRQMLSERIKQGIKEAKKRKKLGR